MRSKWLTIGIILVTGIVLTLVFQAVWLLLVTMILAGLGLWILSLQQWRTLAEDDRQQIEAWVSSNGWRLIACEEMLEGGPFKVMGGFEKRSCHYFRVVVEVPQQGQQVAWVEFAHYFFSRGSMEVKWES